MALAVTLANQVDGYFFMFDVVTASAVTECIKRPSPWHFANQVVASKELKEEASPIASPAIQSV